MRALLEAALRGTQNGRLRWNAFDSESFRAKIGSAFLHINRGSKLVLESKEDMRKRGEASPTTP